ncbi:MAG TPA: DUF58 domain-containing protein [Candidatus Avoscillospira stercorigallinarum]|uniref:DUF58 domain-containing protein n=1 Tax=Candidatus Avoscillospira stercorigallinarum TaxID=2840708 RepID=A0A9D0Z763_9FIRM|nr:DUF58 domain-containing protein [Candidatus Avoscillospira stercorigallinarum]
MLRNWLVYLLGLAGALVFHIYYFGWYSWFVLVLAVALPWFSLLVSLLAMLRTRLRMDAPALLTRNEAAYVTLRAGNGFLPQPLCRFRLTITAVMTGERRSLRQSTQSQGSWYVPLDTAHAGAYLCQVEKARVYDYLGLFRLPVRAPAPVETVIRPVPREPARLPNLRHFLVRQLKPKPGGGFSEEHELRDYRPGDSMREIHWKLSVKTDRTIVREAQEPVRGLTLLTFDLRGTPGRVDATLEELLWLSQWLLDHDTPHQILWIDPTDCETATAPIEAPADLEALLSRLLRTPLRPDTPSLEGRTFPRATWRCHISPQEDAS